MAREVTRLVVDGVRRDCVFSSSDVRCRVEKGKKQKVLQGVDAEGRYLSYGYLDGDGEPFMRSAMCDETSTESCS